MESKEMCQVVNQTIEPVKTRTVNRDRQCEKDGYKDVRYNSSTHNIDNNGCFCNHANNLSVRQNQLCYNQNFIAHEIRSIDEKFNCVIRDMRKERRSLIDSILIPNEKKELVMKLVYDNGNTETVPFFLNINGDMQIFTVLAMDERYSFAVLYMQSNKITIVIEVSEIKGMTLYNLVERTGIRLNARVNKKWITKALNEYVLAQVSSRKNVINMTGLAGWENGRYETAESVEYLNLYRHKFKFPIFQKHFAKDVVPNIRTRDYSICIQKICNREHRVLFALLPIAGIMFSVLKSHGLNIPFVLNLILMDDKINLARLVQYFQIFNRSKFSTISVSDTTKNIKSILSTSKDEVLCFVGLHHEEDSHYADHKITKNLNYISQKALLRSGLEYGENEIQSVIVLLSNERIAQQGVMNIFVETDFFDIGNHDTKYDPIHFFLASFINYVEINWRDVMKLLDAKYDVASEEERYWRVLISLVNEFWEMTGMSLEKILGLPDDFNYDFLWKQDMCYLEDAEETVIKAVRRSVKYVNPVSKDMSKGEDGFIIDDKYIWITPELFSKIIEREGLHGEKERLLLGTKKAGLLCVSEYGGYTTRLQINNIRREYYRFKKEKFDQIGLVSLFD